MVANEGIRDLPRVYESGDPLYLSPSKSIKTFSNLRMGIGGSRGLLFSSRSYLEHLQLSSSSRFLEPGRPRDWEMSVEHEFHYLHWGNERGD